MTTLASVDAVLSLRAYAFLGLPVGLATGGYEGGYTRWGAEPGNCGRMGDPHTWQNTKSGPT